MAASGAIILVAVAAALLLTRMAPLPAADVSRGTEEAFADGLHRREIAPGSGPQRWTEERTRLTFRNLPLTPMSVTVEIRDSRGAVTVVCDGVVAGRLAPGPRTATFELPAAGRRTRVVELWTEGFRAGDGRVLGARLGRVALTAAARPRWPAPGTLAQLFVPALIAFAAARLAGGQPAAACAIAAALLAFQCALVAPAGLVHSDYAIRLAALLSAGPLLALGFARAVQSRHPGAGLAAFVALLAAWLVQVVAGTSPVMVVSDAVFHANKLLAVAGGDLFPVSVTQHARPFRFPYGVSFYALLAPLARAGIDTLVLVRVGAALFGLVATAALFLLALARRGQVVAVLSAVLLQLLPGAFDIAYSYGNLSNAFGQAMTVLFFCWWAGRSFGGWTLGALLLALAALAHFSSLVFIVALVVALVAAESRRGELDRVRRWTAVAGLLVAVVYYAHFASLVFAQVPRLLEGGGQGRGASQSAIDAARLQVLGLLGQWGLPAIVLAWIGRPRWRGGDRYDADLVAYWAAGLVLAIPAIVSPLDVRYLYGLTAALALSAGAGAAALDAAGGVRRMIGRVLVFAQAALFARAAAEAIFVRYRA
jgi:hypothetical protein